MILIKILSGNNAKRNHHLQCHSRAGGNPHKLSLNMRLIVLFVLTSRIERGTGARTKKSQVCLKMAKIDFNPLPKNNSGAKGTPSNRFFGNAPFNQFLYAIFKMTFVNYVEIVLFLDN
jgi:hypothetical protein